jgi:hypothetical protein
MSASKDDGPPNNSYGLKEADAVRKAASRNLLCIKISPNRGKFVFVNFTSSPKMFRSSSPTGEEKGTRSGPKGVTW